MTSPAIVREVTQADRDAAAALTGDEILAYGMADLCSSVQAFARHRIAALAALDATPGERWRFRIWQDGMVVAAGDAPDRQAMARELWHYAAVYQQDGPIDKIETRVGSGRWKIHASLPTPAQTASGVEG